MFALRRISAKSSSLPVISVSMGAWISLILSVLSSPACASRGRVAPLSIGMSSTSAGSGGAGARGGAAVGNSTPPRSETRARGLRARFRATRAFRKATSAPGDKRSRALGSAMSARCARRVLRVFALFVKENKPTASQSTEATN